MPSEETTEFGGWPRPPRWVWAAAGVAAVAVLAGVVVARSGPHHHPAASSRPKPGAGSRTPGADSAPPWPSAAGACGSRPGLPLIHLAAHPARVQGTVLTGGTALRQVTLGGAVSRPLPGLPDHGLLVTALAAGPAADYALVWRCTSSSPWWVYRIAADGAHRLGRAAFRLLGGAHHAWLVSFPPHTVLTPLGGGRAVTLRPNTDPAADTAAGLVVVAYSERAAGQPTTVELLDPNTGAVLRRLGDGYVVGAAGHVVLVARPGCTYPPPPRACTLESIDLTTGRPTATIKLPPGRVPASDAVISRGGTVAAFELQRARPDPRFTTGAPPRDVVVLHLHTGQLALVPGLELPPAQGAAAGLAFTATGSWLLVTVNEGNDGELLAWRPGMPGPALVTSLPGPLAAAPPLLPASSSPHTG